MSRITEHEKLQQRPLGTAGGDLYIGSHCYLDLRTMQWFLIPPDGLPPGAIAATMRYSYLRGEPVYLPFAYAKELSEEIRGMEYQASTLTDESTITRRVRVNVVKNSKGYNIDRTAEVEGACTKEELRLHLRELLDMTREEALRDVQAARTELKDAEG